MIGRQALVAIGQHEQDGQRADSTQHEAQHVEGGFVGPVHVLHDEHGHPTSAQLAGQGLEYGGPVTRAQSGAQRRPHRVGQVTQRSEHARSAEVVAAADEQPPIRRQLVRQLRHEDRLADAGLTGDEHRTAVADRTALATASDKAASSASRSRICAVTQGLSHRRASVRSQFGRTVNQPATHRYAATVPAGDLGRPCTRSR